MYRYDAIDRAIVEARVAQFRDQTQRFLEGRLSEDAFKPLRLQNGLYIQRHAPMLRVAIPYGMLSSAQLRRLAHIAETYDRGYGHFTTRQNIQFNWVGLDRVPDILAELAEVEMHAIQTSGNCVRNTTTDPLAGVAADEIVDPRPYCELMRQWSTLNPEFAYLPRKFKVAFNGAKDDRAAIRVHDLAFELTRGEDGDVYANVFVGGGQGRTPRLAALIKESLHWSEILTYTEAVLRAYNLWGRRDNIYKARIKILVEAIGPEQFAKDVEAEWAPLRNGPTTVPVEELRRLEACFPKPAYLPEAEAGADLSAHRLSEPRFNRWLKRNTHAHQQPGYRAVTLSLKRTGPAPGDATVAEMRAAADLADAFSYGEIRVTHHQNLVLADVAERDLLALWRAAEAAGLAEPNIGTVTDIIACPGGDFCSLANARSIPIALAVQQRIGHRAEEIGELSLKISGCINACGHHHVGHIGVLGVDKDGEEWFQILLGGRSDHRSALAKILGKAMRAEEIPPAIERMIDLYLSERREGERFIDVAERLGAEPFKAVVYSQELQAA